MAWLVHVHEEFEPELKALPRSVRIELIACVNILAETGPTLGRPHVDTLTGSKHANMKELRFDADNGVWRVAFAFDPARAAILLVAGDKSGVAQKRFYQSLVKRADKRFETHLATMKAKK